MANHKLPICYLGKRIESLQSFVSEVITVEMVNMGCHCFAEMQAFFCMEGHLTECHVGMTCSEAECSHWESEMDAEGELGIHDEDEV